MHFSIPDTQECKEDNGSTYVVSIMCLTRSAGTSEYLSGYNAYLRPDGNVGGFLCAQLGR